MILAGGTICISQKSLAAQTAISKCSMTLPKATYEYTTAKIKPVPVIKDKDITLVKDKDFILSYSNNTKPGRASITIKGIGKYTGTVIRPFTITKKNIANCKVTITPSYYVYNGKTHIPTFKVRNGSISMTRNVSYTAKITNNTNAGLGKIILTGKGNYTGTHAFTFPIYPQDVKLLSSSVKSDSITFKWKSVSGVDGYKLYKYDTKEKKYKSVCTIARSKTNYTVNGLTPNTSYKYAIRAYKKADTTTLQSKGYCYISRTTAPGAVCDFKITSANSKSITMCWTALSGISGYKLYQYDYSRQIFVFMKNLSKDTKSYTVSGLQGSTRYSYALKPYRVEGSEIIIGSILVKDSITTSRSYANQTLYIDGDSIAYGSGSKNTPAYSYGEILKENYGFKLIQKSVPGATLATSKSSFWADSPHIMESVLANANNKYDYAIIEGGVNDYLKSIEPGEVSNSAFFNVSTTAGALEQIFYHFRTHCPNTKLYFLIPHKIYNQGGEKRNIVDGHADYFYDIMNTPNLIGKPYRSYYELFYKICLKYNVPVIDIAKDTLFDATKEVQSETGITRPYCDNYTTNKAGLHPNIAGYTKFYIPQIVKVMGIN